MSSSSGLDGEWRPDSYVVPSDATEAFLMGVRGTARREAILRCLGEHDVERATVLRSTPERTRAALPPFELRHPMEMAGEYLPRLTEHEVDLVRIEFQNPSRDVVCVRARPGADGWELRVVDERGRRFMPRRRWYKERLTLRQMVEFIDSVQMEDGAVGLVTGLFIMEVLGAQSFRKLYGNVRGLPLRVTSAFYPQLGAGMAKRLGAYLESPQFAEVLRATGELESPPRPRVPGPFMWRSRVDIRSVERQCRPVVAAGDESALIAFLAAQELAVAEVPGGGGEVALVVGICCEQARRFELAHRVYQRGRGFAPAAEPVRYWLHNNDAYSLVQLGQHEAALPLSQAAIDIDPHRHNAWKNHGLALAGSGRPVEAARALLRAHTLCPQDERALAHLEDLMNEHGEAILREVPEVAEHFVPGEPESPEEGPRP